MSGCPRCGAPLPTRGQDCPACGTDVALWVGREGQVFGPYSLADLRQAHFERRLGPQDMVMVGSSGDWQPLAQFWAEVKADAPLPDLAPPPPVARDHTGTTVGVLVALAVVLGMAAILAAILIPVFVRAREKAQQSSCLSNVKQIELGLLMYAQDYHECFPPYRGEPSVPPPGVVQSGGVPDAPQYWRSTIYPYLRNQQIFLCPTRQREDSYHFNQRLHGRYLGDIRRPAETLSVYELGYLDGSWPPPHHGGYNLGFVDGHCKWMTRGVRVNTDP